MYSVTYVGLITAFNTHLLPLFQRDCVECLLLHSGSSADNQTCQNLCKDEVITRVDTIGEYAKWPGQLAPFGSWRET